MHLKRLAAPRFWPIHRKEKCWTYKSRPGTFSQDESISMGVIIRDILGLTKSEHETKSILNERKIRLNGRDCTDLNFPVGLMDVIEVMPIGMFYRVLPNKHGLYFKEIKDADVSQLLKVVGKRPLDGKFQYSCNNGFVLLSDKTYGIGDTLKLNGDRVVAHFPFVEGNVALITGGAKVGSVGTIRLIQPGDATRASRVQLQSGDQMSETVKDYVFVIGRDKAEVEL